MVNLSVSFTGDGDGKSFCFIEWRSSFVPSNVSRTSETLRPIRIAAWRTKEFASKKRVYVQTVNNTK